MGAIVGLALGTVGVVLGVAVDGACVGARVVATAV